jgi:hypothetical protein
MLNSFFAFFLAGSLAFGNAAAAPLDTVNDGAVNATTSAVTNPSVSFDLFPGSSCFGSGTHMEPQDGVCLHLPGHGVMDIERFYGSCHDGMFEMADHLMQAIKALRPRFWA